MNTLGVPRNETVDVDVPDGKIDFPIEEIPKSDQQINELQEQILDGKDRYNELGFVFILFVVSVLDYFLFRDMNTSIGIGFICFLELIGLLTLCRRFGIEEPYIFIVAMLKKLTSTAGKPD